MRDLLPGQDGSIYPYYFCVGRQQKRTTCMLKYRPIALVEQQIEEHYEVVQLRAEGLAATGQAIVTVATEQTKSLATKHTRNTRRIRQLEDERTKLLHAHYAEAVPLDLLKQEQARIAKELARLSAGAQQTEDSMENLKDTVAKAVRWAEDCQQAYVASAPRGRRLMNQAFFKRVWVTENGVVGWEYNQPFKTLMEFHGEQPPGFSETAQNDGTEGSQRHHDGKLYCYERRRPVSFRSLLLVSSKQNYLAVAMRQHSNQQLGQTGIRRGGSDQQGERGVRAIRNADPPRVLADGPQRLADLGVVSNRRLLED